VLQRQPATASEALELAAALGDLVERRNLSTTLRHSAARFTEPRFRSRPTSSRAG
jgi:hypothetical protein